jgi:Leucine-rich repeat (LRR) protein
LKQAVADGKISSASELSSLSCSNAGITSLAGLEVFTGLSKLRLSSNSIRDISAVAALTSLELLQLDNNQVIDTTPLLELPALIELNLDANRELLCPSDASLITVEALTLPGHCR